MPSPATEPEGPSLSHGHTATTAADPGTAWPSWEQPHAAWHTPTRPGPGAAAPPLRTGSGRPEEPEDRGEGHRAQASLSQCHFLAEGLRVSLGSQST